MFESIHELWYRVRSRFQRDELDAELQEELKAHAQFLEEEAVRNGASPDDARRAAAFQLGNMSNIRETTRERWSFGSFENVLQDTKYAFRFLRRSPGFTAVAVLSLALGVGANATVFAVADRLMFSPPPMVVNANTLHQMFVMRETQGSKQTPEFYPVTYFPEYFALREQSRLFESVALFLPATRVRLGIGPDAPRIRESMASANYFNLVGVVPQRGRFFVESDEEVSTGPYAAVISHGFWQSHFAGADSAIGSRFEMGDKPYIVVGVAPKSFGGTELDAADVWIPLGATAPFNIGPDWKTRPYYDPHLLVRLREGVQATAASAEATVIVNRVREFKDREFENRTDIKKTAQLGSVITARSPVTKSGEVQVSIKLVIASALVLLAACANLANLLLVRALSRQREIALRLAIGITPLRLASQMLIESLIICALGSTIALLVARWSGDALRSMVFPELQWSTPAVNPRVLVISIACGTVVAIVATMIPAIRMTRSDVSAALRSSAPQLTSSTGYLRRTLLVVQVSLAVLLIVGATAFGKSLNQAYQFNMGMDVDRLITGRFGMARDSLTAPARLLMLEEAARRIRQIPGIEAATVSATIPLTGNTNSIVRIPERELAKDFYASWWPVTPALQSVAGFRLLRGRFFTDADVAPGMTPVVLISESMAQQLWPAQDPIGKCLRTGADTTPCMQVVGMMHDLRRASFREPPPTTMLISSPTPQLKSFSYGYVVMRAKPDVKLSVLIPLARAAMHNVHKDISAIEVQPLAQSLDRHYRPLKLGSTMFASFSALAVVLSAVGLYGILAFSVAQRTTEFGIRGALGARASNIVASVVGESLTVIAIGILIGAVASWYASDSIAGLMFEASSRDVAPYLVATAVLVCVGLGASLVPALRATRVDPAIALRAE